jgi:hypothetical protein
MGTFARSIRGNHHPEHEFGAPLDQIDRELEAVFLHEMKPQGAVAHDPQLREFMEIRQKSTPSLPLA